MGNRATAQRAPEKAMTRVLMFAQSLCGSPREKERHLAEHEAVTRTKKKRTYETYGGSAAGKGGTGRPTNVFLQSPGREGETVERVKEGPRKNFVVEKKWTLPPPLQPREKIHVFAIG